MGSVTESLLIVLALVELYGREYGTIMGQILKLSRKIKVNRTRCQLWLHLSPSLLGPEKHSPHLWPILQAFLADYNSRPALKHSQARLLLPKSERNGPHPRDTFLEPSHTPCLLIPLLLVKNTSHSPVHLSMHGSRLL